MARTGRWIHAAFTPETQREPWMREVLRTSDELVDELLAADIIVAGVPMYNFGPPAQFKAWIDNIVRVGRTFGFDRSREGTPYWPMLADTILACTSSSSTSGKGSSRFSSIRAFTAAQKRASASASTSLGNICAFFIAIAEPSITVTSVPAVPLHSPQQKTGHPTPTQGRE